MASSSLDPDGCKSEYAIWGVFIMRAVSGMDHYLSTTDLWGLYLIATGAAVTAFDTIACGCIRSVPKEADRIHDRDQ